MACCVTIRTHNKITKQVKKLFVAQVLRVTKNINNQSSNYFLGVTMPPPAPPLKLEFKFPVEEPPLRSRCNLENALSFSSVPGAADCFLA